MALVQPGRKSRYVASWHLLICIFDFMFFIMSRRLLHMGCVLDRLGADTFGSLHLNTDGMFPNHIPNPEDKTAMALTRAAVLQNTADLGIVFYTDVDRSGVVDNKGNPINGDKLIALMSAIVLREHPEPQ